TIKDVLVHDGIPMDTTYVGKAYWGMKEYIKKNEIAEKNILFIHTGGTPLFFDDLGDIADV
ncbi:MAG: 1-aminocyclopropane-1-carboxylate deaminase, partial [Clostridium sp.]|nr:1-aminocyclopropane-1-carboxylate deaminase [Clostridium sp.]